MAVQTPGSSPAPLTFSGFDWDIANLAKSQKHGGSRSAIESMFDRAVAVFPDPEHSIDEERFKAVGTTDTGRFVLVVFTLRLHAGQRLIRPISARYMHRKRSPTMKKKLPTLRTDQAAERFVATADLTQYDLSGMKLVKFEFQPKTERVNMRLPQQLLEAVKASAVKARVPYQRFIRQALEEAVQRRAAG